MKPSPQARPSGVPLDTLGKLAGRCFRRCRVLAFVLASMPVITARAGDKPPQVIFNPKLFHDGGDIVHVEGTAVGEHIGYMNNRTALTCYRRTGNCVEVQLESEGMQVFNIRPPHFFTVRLWTADRITADSSAPCGDPPLPTIKKEDWASSESQMWIVDRTRKTAEEIDHQCAGSATYHWTIEDPEWVKSRRKAPD